MNLQLNNSTRMESNRDSNLKIRRCRHGRIIVKDSSKKKIVQLGDKETNKELKTVKGMSEVIHQSSSSLKFKEILQKQTCDEPKISSESIGNDIADCKSLSNEHENSPKSTDDSPSSDIYDPEEPVLPISPGDSPPLSPLNNAANHKMDVEKNHDDGVPSSAVQLNHQVKYLQKLNRQERVVEEVKLALKPHYQRRAIDKEQYKDILRRAVPKVSRLPIRRLIKTLSPRSV